MEYVLKSIKKNKSAINPAIVISNKEDAKGLKTAKRLGINTEVVESKGFDGTRWEYDKKIIKVLRKNGVTPKNGLVCLAGFMRIISPEFVKKIQKQNNQHSSFVTSSISRIRFSETGLRIWCKSIRAARFILLMQEQIPVLS